MDHVHVHVNAHNNEQPEIAKGSEMVTEKPKSQAVHTQRLITLISPELLEKIEDYRRNVPGRMPSTAEAVRQLIEKGLSAASTSSNQ
jgi:hypothetical protein